MSIRKPFALASCLVIMLAVIAAPKALAHFPVSESSGKGSGELHITPSDTVKAGVKSNLHFEIDTDIDFKAAEASFTVKESGSPYDTVLPSLADNTGIAADYTFPKAGDYEVSLSLALKGETRRFTKTLSVSRPKNLHRGVRQRGGW